VQEEMVYVGNFKKDFCNHLISRKALQQWILSEADSNRFAFPCPVCKVTRCDQCSGHGSIATCCFIPQHQIKSLLTEEEMQRWGPCNYQIQQSIIENSKNAEMVLEEEACDV
jgi:hypothetical protein